MGAAQVALGSEASRLPCYLQTVCHQAPWERLATVYALREVARQWEGELPGSYW
jgi:hypothetical protein